MRGDIDRIQQKSRNIKQKLCHRMEVGGWKMETVKCKDTSNTFNDFTRKIKKQMHSFSLKQLSHTRQLQFFFYLC